MAHEIDMSNGRENMAYVGSTPWHGLGTELSEDADLDTWRIEAGLDWRVLSAPVQFVDASQAAHAVNDKQVLYRSDTKAALGIVSRSYNIVQPGEILEFYEDLTEHFGFSLNTAGSLKGGRIIWALAKTGKHFTLGRKDRVEGYLLLSTSNDKTMATRAQFTSVRVVCNNTLHAALAQSSSGLVSVSHASRFDAAFVKEKLGIYKSGWSNFTDAAKEMARYKLKDNEALEMLGHVFLKPNRKLEDIIQTATVRNVFELYKDTGMGHDLASANGTLWGLVNGVTEFIDYHRGRSNDSRLVNAWFKGGARVKERAWNEALKKIA